MYAYRIHTYKDTYIHIDRQTANQTDRRTDIHHMHVYIHINIYIYTYIYIYISCVPAYTYTYNVYVFVYVPYIACEKRHYMNSIHDRIGAHGTDCSQIR